MLYPNSPRITTTNALYCLASDVRQQGGILAQYLQHGRDLEEGSNHAGKGVKSELSLLKIFQGPCAAIR